MTGAFLCLCFYLCPSVKSVVRYAFMLDKHLLPQAASEGLGEFKLLSHAYDLAGRGWNEI